MTREGPLMAVSDAELDGLRTRLRAARRPEPWPRSVHTGLRAGIDDGELFRLAAYWVDGYDWRAHEAEVNALPSRFADVNGTAVHYLRFDGEHPDALPIVLTHGWPSSFLELVTLAQLLAEPSRYGGNPADAFTVIVPSLPGYAFSPQRPSIPPDLETHEIWHRLMCNELGFERYLAHGGDLGAGITSRLAEAHPDAVAGIHLLAVAAPSSYDDASLTDEEQSYLAQVSGWNAAEGAYQHQQSTRPLTLAHGLSDSPTGLLAWLVEKYLAWTDRSEVAGEGLPASRCASPAATASGSATSCATPAAN